MIFCIQIILVILICSVYGRVYHDKIKVNNKGNSLSNEQSENISQIEKIKSWNFGFIKGGTSNFYMRCPTKVGILFIISICKRFYSFLKYLYNQLLLTNC